MNIENQAVVECACATCQSACQSRPGWFLPGEAEKAAALLEMPLGEFFKKHLAVDWLEGRGNVYLLAPALAGETPGGMYPAEPTGTCGLYRDRKCLIHEAKPRECAIAHHHMTQENGAENHIAIGRKWKEEKHQKQVRDLLGTEPEAPLTFFPGWSTGERLTVGLQDEDDDE